MKKFKILALALVALMVLSLTLVACNPTNDNNGDGNGTGNGNGTGDGGAKTKYTLTVWGSQEDQAMLKEMCAAYAAANPQNEYKFLFGVQSEADAADRSDVCYLASIPVFPK